MAIVRKVLKQCGTRIGVGRAGVHTLNIPYNHLPYVKYEDGVPVRKIRKIQPWEIAAGYGRVWTTAEDKSVLPNVSALAFVPEHEVWIITRNGKFNRAITDGSYLLIPFIDKISALRSPYTQATGIFSSCESAENVPLDVYTIIYYKWVDFEKSYNFRDIERGNCDAETCMQYLTMEAMARTVPGLKLKGDGKIEPEFEKKLNSAVQEFLSEFIQKAGIEIVDVEIRGAWNTSLEVPLKMYSMEPEADRPDIQVSVLPNDYWGDVLEPPPFLRYSHGTHKLIQTPAVTSLEWAIPSPPDYHHYNMAPVVLMDPEVYKKKGGKLLI